MFAKLRTFVRASRTNLALSIALVVLLAVAGTAVIATLPFWSASSAPVATKTPRPTPTESDVVPFFQPDAGAAANKPYFDYVNKQTIQSKGDGVVGDDFINGLAAAGFDRNAMQVTPDRTAADLQADSIQFSVQMGEQCLIGQWGSGSKGYQSTVANVVNGIGCLIGKTRPVNG